MKRGLALGLLIVIGSISLAATQAQGPTPEQVAYVKIEPVKGSKRLYIVTGSDAEDKNFTGGNVGVFITDAGVILVDSKLAGFGPTIVDRVKSVTNKSIIALINTHSHGDHTGSNEFFGNNVESIVQENTKANMVKMDEFKGDKARFLPKRTYKDKFTIGSGDDQVDLYHFGPAHTNGDTFIVFTALRTMHVGDVFAWKALPFIDDTVGGSVLNHPEAIEKAAKVKNVDTIINGHIPVSTLAELKEYAAFSKDFVEWGKKELKAGKTVAQGAAEYKVPEKYKGYKVSVDPRWGSPTANLQILYDELNKKK
jgi:cyclase